MSDPEKTGKPTQQGRSGSPPPHPTGNSTASFEKDSRTIWDPPRQAGDGAGEGDAEHTIVGHAGGAGCEDSVDRAGGAGDIDRTLDLGERAQVEQHLATMWGDQSQADPGQTLRSGSRFDTPGASLSPKRRALSRPGAPRDPASDFEFQEVLGEGGMGVVYRARQTSIDREIAVKMIRPRYARDESQCGKFLTEAVVTGDLEHPNIVPVYDLGTDENDHPFYAMKWVRGTPWSDVLRKMTLKENLEVFGSVCDAVAFAHSKGVLHRDLKPANVMLGEFGEVLVMDWGLSVSVNETGKAARVSDQSAMAGTPAYMSPEMANGETEKISQASDVYLLGGILYELVTGKQPHAGSKVMDCLVNAAFNNIQESEVVGELVDIAMKAMATEPAERYESVKDLQGAIRDYESHAQSIGLCERSRSHFERGMANGHYDDFVQALFGFRQALELWRGNVEAAAAITEVSLQYARRALAKNDLDLAASLLDADNPRHVGLMAQIEEARREQESRRRRYMVYRRTATVLAAVIILVLSVSYVIIRAEKQRAVEAEQAARIAKVKAEDEREKAVAAQRAEAAQRRIADEATARAKEEEAKATGALEKMKAAVKAMMEAQSLEEEARARAKTAELMAADAQDRLAKSGMLLDNSWWTLSASEATRQQQRAAKESGYAVDQTLSVGPQTDLELVLVPAGSFVMGSQAKEQNRGGEEYLHRVVLTRPFYMGRYEVTVAQWRAVVGAVPEARGDEKEVDGRWPVMGVSWRDVHEQFLPKLQAFAPAGMRFRLPTEAEWEYACRAGSGAAYNQGDSEESLQAAGWYLSNSERTPHPVGQKQPNQWGLYDMHGNVAEWCLDTYDPRFYLVAGAENPLNRFETEKRIIRGGGCINLPQHCRSAYRSWANPDNRYRFLGFRVVLAEGATSRAMQVLGGSEPGGVETARGASEGPREVHVVTEEDPE